MRGRLATADAETRRLRTQLSRVDADKKAWEGERSLYIKETESLRRLAATYDNDADATLKKRVSDLESQLEAAAKALRDSKPPASEPANEAPQPSKNETEEFRIVHLVDNPAAAAAASAPPPRRRRYRGRRRPGHAARAAQGTVPGAPELVPGRCVSVNGLQGRHAGSG